jgi:hypothetical protein
VRERLYENVKCKHAGTYKKFEEVEYAELQFGGWSEDGDEGGACGGADAYADDAVGLLVGAGQEGDGVLGTCDLCYLENF